MQKKEYSLNIGEKILSAEFTDLAEQAHGSVIVRLGNTTVLTTAVISDETRNGLGYFPLSVEYEERFYAAGQILGSRFMRREGRPSDEAVLSGRIVDRTIRPLFEKHIRNDVQVVVTILSIDHDDPDILAVNAASLALATSNIPWGGPVSAVRIAKQRGSDELIINPTYEEREAQTCEFDLVACGKDGSINMIEVGGREVDEATLARALERATEEIEKVQDFQRRIIAEIGRDKRAIEKPQAPSEMHALFAEKIAPRLEEAVFSGAGKKGIKELGGAWEEAFAEALPDADRSVAEDLYDEAVNDLLHTEAIGKKRRADGRSLDEIRPLFAQAGGVSSMLHGTGVFYRGGTHILSALTLGGPQDSLLIDGMEVQTKKHFMHHYNFPPFSSGETGRVGGFNRRQIGHGALAEKALAPVIPPRGEFPYTIRIVSEAFASNGSTSMGSVCAAALALMDAGVPIAKPVAGIASGLMMKDADNYALLTDIQGPEDEHGDMDLKVAGTRDGVTAIQMDVKVDGIPVRILNEALEKAREARLAILDVIEKEISAPRPELSPNAPKIVTTNIEPGKIGLVIGSGGKTINDIKERTGTEIEIEDDGSVFITGKGDGPESAQRIVEEMTHEYTAGEKAEGVITKIVDFGAFVKIGYNTEGLVHVSEIAPFRVEKVSDYLKEGDTIPVIVKEVNGDGKISLSIKRADPDRFQTKSA